MKKQILFLLAVAASTLTVNAQKLSIDKVEDNGQRTLISKSYNLYTEFTTAAAFRLGCFIIPENGDFDTTFVLMLTLNEGKLQIDQGRKLLFKFDDNSIMELSSLTKIGPADYTYNVTKYGTDYFVKPDYSVTEEQIEMMISKKAVKVRIEYDLDVIDREMSPKKNKLSKGLSEAYSTIKKALTVKKDVYSDF